jgi:hypothetical protein
MNELNYNEIVTTAFKKLLEKIPKEILDTCEIEFTSEVKEVDGKWQYIVSGTPKPPFKCPCCQKTILYGRTHSPCVEVTND